MQYEHTMRREVSMRVRERATSARRGERYRDWARGLLRLYPRAWRERYGKEVAELLREYPASPWTALDVLLGALDAHLHSELLPGGIVSMAHRIRNSEIAIFCAYILFFVPWLALQRVPDPLPGWNADIVRHPELGQVFAVMEIAGYVAFLAVVAGAIPIVFAALRQAVAGRRREVLLPFALAVVTTALYVALTAVIFVVIGSRPGTGIRPLRMWDAVLTLVWLAASLGGAVLGPFLVSLGVARSNLSLGVVRLALIPAAILVAAIAMGATAALALTVLTAQRSPDLYNSALSPIVIAVMVAASVLAVAALWRGLSVGRGPSAAGTAG
jgi:hypothetical protein